jgi:hypothetical protein
LRFEDARAALAWLWALVVVLAVAAAAGLLMARRSG